jgi:hypothetical protein
MDIVIAVACCNLAIAIVVLVLTIWTIRFRRQVVALAECCDQWENDCQLLLDHAPASLAVSKVQISSFQQLYRQQLTTLDRLRAVGLFLGVARAVLSKRR